MSLLDILHSARMFIQHHLPMYSSLIPSSRSIRISDLHAFTTIMSAYRMPHVVLNSKGKQQKDCTRVWQRCEMRVHGYQDIVIDHLHQYGRMSRRSGSWMDMVCLSSDDNYCKALIRISFRVFWSCCWCHIVCQIRDIHWRLVVGKYILSRVYNGALLIFLASMLHQNKSPQLVRSKTCMMVDEIYSCIDIWYVF